MITTTDTSLSDREVRVLEAVIQRYVTTAQPSGSRTLARRFRLDASAATIRNTMSDLEEKGYLHRAHTSAGRVPTDKAYRLYVDRLLRVKRVTPAQGSALRSGVSPDRQVGEAVLEHAAHVLSLLTHEMGVGLAPRLEEGILEKMDLVSVSSTRLLLVLTIRSGIVRTIFVEVPLEVSPLGLERIAEFLNRRLAGLSLREIRATLSERVHDADEEHRGLLNFFIESADEVFTQGPPESQLILEGTSNLAAQPEFADGSRLRGLIELTEKKGILSHALADPLRSSGLVITIGREHRDQHLADFSIVTATYRAGSLTGAIGVMGPTRMPYDKVVALVDYTSKLISSVLTPERREA